MSLKLRKVWLTVHRWLGLTAGLLFVLSGLTGSAIVFDHALDERLNASLMRSQQAGDLRPLADVVAAVQGQLLDGQQMVSLHYPRVAGGTYTVHVRNSHVRNSKASRDQAAVGKTEMTELFVDPVTTEILGQRVRNSGLMADIYRLHATLLSGATGEIILGTLALLVLVSLTSGLLLWWPLVRQGLRTGLAIRRRLLIYDLHKSLGAVSAPVLLLVTATGVYFTLPGLIKPFVTAFSPETRLPRQVKSAPAQPGAAPIGPDAAAAVATTIMPGCRLMSVELPARPEDAYRVFVRQAGEVGDLRGVGRVWVDQYTGECLATRDWNRFTFADTFFRIQLALHSGDAFGLAGRWLFCLAGFAPAVLYVTGFILWRKNRKARQLPRRRIEQRRAERLPAESSAPPLSESVVPVRSDSVAPAGVTSP